MTSDDSVDSKIGKALDFDGSDVFCRYGDDTVLDITDTLALEAVERPSVTLDSTMAKTAGILCYQDYPAENVDPYPLQILEAKGVFLLDWIHWGGIFEALKIRGQLMRASTWLAPKIKPG